MFGRRDKRTLDVAEAADAQRAGRLVLVDVREDRERAQGFAPGSVHLPLGQLPDRVGDLPADRPLAFICQSGRRSAMAAAAARRAGFEVHNVSGGMNAWQRQGLTIETNGSSS